MVVVQEPVSRRERALRVHRVRPGQVFPQILGVRRVPLPRATPPAVRERPGGRHHLRPDAVPARALGVRGAVHALRGRGGVHERGHAVPLCDDRRSRRPAAAGVAVAPALRSPVDGDVGRGLLGVSLAPVSSARVCRVWCEAGRGGVGADGGGAGRVWGVGGDARPWDVGARARDGVQHCGGVLLAHGRRGGFGACVWGVDGAEGGGIVGVGVDDGVDGWMGHAYD